MGENADFVLPSQDISGPDLYPLRGIGKGNGLGLFSGRSDSIALTTSSSQAPRINSRMALLWWGNIRWSNSKEDLNVSVSFLWGEGRGTWARTYSGPFSSSLKDLLRFSSASENPSSSKLAGLTGSSLILTSHPSLHLGWIGLGGSFVASLSASEWNKIRTIISKAQWVELIFAGLVSGLGQLKYQLSRETEITQRILCYSENVNGAKNRTSNFQ